MMTAQASLGAVYRCDICAAEITVLVRRHGEFVPRCCNCQMILQPQRRAGLYVCPICGAEIALVRTGRAGSGTLQPRCCNTDMIAQAA